jgi:hypothetical protein
MKCNQEHKILQRSIPIKGCYREYNAECDANCDSVISSYTVPVAIEAKEWNKSVLAVRRLNLARITNFQALSPWPGGFSGK